MQQLINKTVMKILQGVTKKAMMTGKKMKSMLMQRTKMLNYQWACQVLDSGCIYRY